jgi:hypothetical protein
MIDVDARGWHEAELVREEAARIADTETALQSVLAGEVVVPLEPHRPAQPRPVARRRMATRRWIKVLAGIAAAVVAVLVVRQSNDPEVGTPANTAVTSSTELIVRSLDPPIRCELERCPTLAVGQPEGTLVAYDQAAKTLTWYYAEPWVLPVTVDLDAEHVQLEAIDGYGGFAYLLAGSPGTESWELVVIDPQGEVVRRATGSSPDVEPSNGGLVERLCWSGCEQATRTVLPWVNAAGATYPDITYATGTVTVQLGELRWAIAWPDPLSTRSQVAPRWDGGAVLSLVPESDAPSELIELLPDGSVQRFSLDDEAVHVLLSDGSAVVWRDGQLLRLSPPQPAEPPAAWSPELTARPLELAISCDRSPLPPECPQLAVSPDGTLVAYDRAAATLTWYEDEPRVVPISAELWGNDLDGGPDLLAIGPHDVAYFQSWSPPENDLVAVAPSGAEIRREPWSMGHSGIVLRSPTASGLVAMQCTFTMNQCTGGTEWPAPDAALAMPWVDLAGNPITDTRPYPVARGTDAGIEVRFGQREWLLAGEAWRSLQMPEVFPRSDGGVVMLHSPFEDFGRANLFELLPDGTIERYFVNGNVVLPDGSLIVEHNVQLVRLTPPAPDPQSLPTRP